MEHQKERRRIKRLAAARSLSAPQTGLTLQQKVAWTLAAVAMYCIAMALVISLERGFLFRSLNDIESIHQLEQNQIALNMAVSRVILDIDNNYWEKVDRAANALAMQTENVIAGLEKLRPLYPMLSQDIKTLKENVSQLNEYPSNEIIADTRAHFYQLVPTLDSISTSITNQKQYLLDEHRRSFERLSFIWIVFGGLGILLLGGLLAWFFRRLGKDIQRVHHRAIEIVDGYRGEPLPVTRHDELGSLIEAVNDMQHGLREHESRLELSRQQQFHKDKMAAVGSLAAAVAHEINNPLSAIVGVAEAIKQEKHPQQGHLDGVQDKPDLILEHARRVMAITRQISEFAVPRSPDPQLFDLNGLLRGTCNFVSYDRRFRLLELAVDLDSDVPAVFGVADHLMQVTMNLLINACDALQNQLDPSPKIRVASFVKDGKVTFEVSDNGCGISPENLKRVFNEFFTTKGPESGSGIGLSLCRKLMQEAGGDISIASTTGTGTTVTVTLPTPDATQ